VLGSRRVLPVRFRELAQVLGPERPPDQVNERGLQKVLQLIASTLNEASETCWACGAQAHLDGSYTPAELYRCPACGFLFSALRTTDELRELYDAEYFDDYTGGESYEQDAAQRRYESRLRVELVRRYCESGRLLEIGAASGYFLEAAKAAGFSVLGIEPVAEVAERARQQLGVDVSVGFLEDIELEDGSFDAVCAWHVLEHLSDPGDALARVARALSPGGYFFAEVPHIDSPAARRRKLAWRPLDLRHHVGHYNASAITALLERSGLDVVHIETFPFLGYVRPLRALHPLVAGAQVKETLFLRTIPRRPHPSKHELLRVVARAPG
jgi:SAM-dependent methyltransferase